MRKIASFVCYGRQVISPAGASQAALVIKNPPANAGDLRDEGLIPGWEDPLRRKWQATSVFLPG